MEPHEETEASPDAGTPALSRVDVQQVAFTGLGMH